MSLGRRPLLMVVDMQCLFDTHPDWGGPGLRRILPNVVALCRKVPTPPVFTRFVPPPLATDAPGAWRRYYERWPGATGDATGPAVVELVPELRPFAHPERLIDKPTYSAFAVPATAALLERLRPDCLILAGVETDVCVLATLLAAVDLGYPVVVAADAVASADDTAHLVVLDHLLPRLDAQVTLTTTASLIAEWPEPG